MTIATAFVKLLARQTTDTERARLHALRDDLGLSNDDALWSLVGVVEDYCATLLARSNARSSPASGSDSTQLADTAGWRGWALFCAGLGAQMFLMAITFEAGARSSHIPWLSDANRTSSWFVRALAAPAGWMIFALAQPALLFAAVSGLRVKRRDPAIGWTLLLGSSTTEVVVAATLWWLMRA